MFGRTLEMPNKLYFDMVSFERAPHQFVLEVYYSLNTSLLLFLYSSFPGLMFLLAEPKTHLKLTSIVFIDIHNRPLDCLWRNHVFCSLSVRNVLGILGFCQYFVHPHHLALHFYSTIGPTWAPFAVCMFTL